MAVTVPVARTDDRDLASEKATEFQVVVFEDADSVEVTAIPGRGGRRSYATWSGSPSRQRVVKRAGEPSPSQSSSGRSREDGDCHIEVHLSSIPGGVTFQIEPDNPSICPGLLRLPARVRQFDRGEARVAEHEQLREHLSALVIATQDLPQRG
jgi:hypothetical protein